MDALERESERDGRQRSSQPRNLNAVPFHGKSCSIFHYLKCFTRKTQIHFSDTSTITNIYYSDVSISACTKPFRSGTRKSKRTRTEGELAQTHLCIHVCGTARNFEFVRWCSGRQCGLQVGLWFEQGCQGATQHFLDLQTRITTCSYRTNRAFQKHQIISVRNRQNVDPQQ